MEGGSRAAGRTAQREVEAPAPGLLPTPDQELLLDAALAEGEAAREAWCRWRRRVEFEDRFVDPGSFRLLPLAWWNLDRAGFDDPVMARLRGVYRLWWVRNRRLLHGIRPAVDALAEAGVDALALKGLPLAFEHYPAFALRPMVDADLAVRPADVDRALHCLAARGWIPVRAPDGHQRRHWHAVLLRGPDRCDIDLHWRPLREAGDDAEAFWPTARACESSGLRIQAPDATDLLLHTVVHGAEWNPVPPVRWVADAVLLLRQGEIDADRLVSRARAWNVALRLARGLAYVEHRFDTKAPAGVVERLTEPPIPRLERIEARLVQWPSRGPATAPLRLARAAVRFSLRTRGWPPRRRGPELARWLAHGLAGRLAALRPGAP
jgi:hypothetical protein